MNGYRMNGYRILNTALFGVLGCLLLAHLLLRIDHSRRNYEFMPDMVHSKAYESFSSNPNLPDQMTQQPPVPGSVPRGLLPLHYGPSKAEAQRAGEELKNPLAVVPRPKLDLLTRGGVLFDRFCAPCHGSGAKGDGPVTKRGFPPPPSLLTDASQKMKDGQLFHIITYGQGNMAPYAPQISRTDRWKIILHIRALQNR